MQEDFVRENFEEDTFSQIPLEKFLESSEALEKQATERGAGGGITGMATPAAARISGLESSAPFSPRLSLSARFMSRAGPSVFKLVEIKSISQLLFFGLFFLGGGGLMEEKAVKRFE